MFYDSTYILMIPAILISLYAQYKVSSTFNKYIRVRNSRGITGADAARRILDANGLNHIRVERVGGRLSDHYDPRSRVVRLSPEVYSEATIAAVGVAAHETGHAIQHNKSYIPLMLRNGLFPVASLGSSAAWIFIFLGLVLQAAGGIFIKIGIILFSLAVLFQIVTLPVEFNASRRALAMLTNEGYFGDDEIRSTKKVLSAAAFTYVAAALVAIMELLRMILLSRSDD